MSIFLRTLIRSEDKSCTNKVKYPREDSAQNAVVNMMAKKPGEFFEHYFCEFCRNWHIGHRTNFDWIPLSHDSYTLMVNKFQCSKTDCNDVFYSTTVISNRILSRFPGIERDEEMHVVCHKCRTAEPNELGRKMIPLSDIAADCTDGPETLWQNDLLGRMIYDMPCRLRMK